jgi:serine/threonine-protein phosphatase 2B catalytic subunit
LPGDLDLFQWSLPFLVDKITDMIERMTNKNDAITPKSSKTAIENMSFGQMSEALVKSAKADNQIQQKAQQKVKLMERVRAKVRTIGRMNKMLRVMRENAEKLDTIKRVAPDGKVPVGTVMGGIEEIDSTLMKFY